MVLKIEFGAVSYLLSCNNFFFQQILFQVREHPEFKSVTQAEKSKVMKTLKAVMPRSEELKKLLKAQYEAEYEDYQQMVEIEMQRQAQIAEEQRKWKLQQEGNYKVKLN